MNDKKMKIITYHDIFIKLISNLPGMYHKILINNNQDIEKLLSSNIPKNLIHCKISYPFNKDVTDDDFLKLKDVHSINMHYCKQITDKGFENLGCPIALDISRCKQITNNGLVKFITNIIKTNNHLRVLNLSYIPKITDRGLVILGKIDKLGLQELYLSNNSEVTDDAIKIIARNNTIKIINLSKCKKITNASLLELKKLEIGIFSKCKSLNNDSFLLFRNLIKLNVSNCKNLTDMGISLICNNSNLEELILTNCTRITNHAFTYIKTLTKLKTLNIDHCNAVSDDGITMITVIKHISLVNCNISNTSIFHLSNISDLESINIYGHSKINHNAICKLSSLKSIDASFCDICDDTIKDKTQLEKLLIAGCVKISHMGIINFTNLVYLDLSWCNLINTQGIIKILEQNPIENLNLNWCRAVNDECMMYVKKARYISLIGCKNVTDVGCNNLCKNLLELQDALTNTALVNNADNLTNNFVGKDDYYFFGQKNRTHTLQYLDLSYCTKITDLSIEYLTVISILCLKINNNPNITDAQLINLSGLHTLGISYCPQICGSGLVHLKQLHTLNIVGDEFDEKYVSELDNVHKLLV